MRNFADYLQDDPDDPFDYLRRRRQSSPFSLANTQASDPYGRRPVPDNPFTLRDIGDPRRGPLASRGATGPSRSPLGAALGAQVEGSAPAPLPYKAATVGSAIPGALAETGYNIGIGAKSLFGGDTTDLVKQKEEARQYYGVPYGGLPALTYGVTAFGANAATYMIPGTVAARAAMAGRGAMSANALRFLAPQTTGATGAGLVGRFAARDAALGAPFNAVMSANDETALLPFLNEYAGTDLPDNPLTRFGLEQGTDMLGGALFTGAAIGGGRAKRALGDYGRTRRERDLNNWIGAEDLGNVSPDAPRDMPLPESRQVPPKSSAGELRLDESPDINARAGFSGATVLGSMAGGMAGGGALGYGVGTALGLDDEDRAALTTGGFALGAPGGFAGAGLARRFAQSRGYPMRPLGTDIAGMAGTPQGPRMIATHNLYADKLDAVARQGGFIPYPSIGVAAEDTPYQSFGDITLIGRRSLADPQEPGVQAWDADSYTTTPGDASHRWRPITNVSMLVGDPERGAPPYPSGDLDLTDAREVYDRLVQEFSGDDKRVQGLVAKYIRGYEDGAISRNEAVEAISQEVAGELQAIHGPDWRDVADIDEIAVADALVGDAINRPGEPPVRGADAADLVHRETARESGVRAGVVASVLDRPLRMPNGELDIRGTQSMFGPAAVRGASARPMESIEQMRGEVARRQQGQVEPGERASEFYTDEVAETLDALPSFIATINAMNDGTLPVASSRALPVSAYDLTYHPEFNVGTVKLMDERRQGRAQSVPEIRAALGEGSGVAKALANNMSDEDLLTLVGKLDEWYDQPTAYLEAKVTDRPVSLSEFSGAVVPRWVDPQYRDILTEAGLPIEEYDDIDGVTGRGTLAERAKAVARSVKAALDRGEYDVAFNIAMSAGASSVADLLGMLPSGTLGAAGTPDGVPLKLGSDMKTVDMDSPSVPSKPPAKPPKMWSLRTIEGESNPLVYGAEAARDDLRGARMSDEDDETPYYSRILQTLYAYNLSPDVHKPMSLQHWRDTLARGVKDGRFPKVELDYGLEPTLVRLAEKGTKTISQMELAHEIARTIMDTPRRASVSASPIEPPVIRWNDTEDGGGVREPDPDAVDREAREYADSRRDEAEEEWNRQRENGQVETPDDVEYLFRENEDIEALAERVSDALDVDEGLIPLLEDAASRIEDEYRRNVMTRHLKALNSLNAATHKAEFLADRGIYQSQVSIRSMWELVRNLEDGDTGNASPDAVDELMEALDELDTKLAEWDRRYDNADEEPDFGEVWQDAYDERHGEILDSPEDWLDVGSDFIGGKVEYAGTQNVSQMSEPDRYVEGLIGRRRFQRDEGVFLGDQRESAYGHFSDTWPDELRQGFGHVRMEFRDDMQVSPVVDRPGRDNMSVLMSVLNNGAIRAGGMDQTYAEIINRVDSRAQQAMAGVKEAGFSIRYYAPEGTAEKIANDVAGTMASLANSNYVELGIDPAIMDSDADIAYGMVIAAVGERLRQTSAATVEQAGYAPESAEAVAEFYREYAEDVARAIASPILVKGVELDVGGRSTGTDVEDLTKTAYVMEMQSDRSDKSDAGAANYRKSAKEGRAPLSEEEKLQAIANAELLASGRIQRVARVGLAKERRARERSMRAFRSPYAMDAIRVGAAGEVVRRLFQTLQANGMRLNTQLRDVNAYFVRTRIAELIAGYFAPLNDMAPARYQAGLKKWQEFKDKVYSPDENPEMTVADLLAESAPIIEAFASEVERLGIDPTEALQRTRAYGNLHHADELLAAASSNMYHGIVQAPEELQVVASELVGLMPGYRGNLDDVFDPSTGMTAFTNFDRYRASVEENVNREYYKMNPRNPPIPSARVAINAAEYPIDPDVPLESRYEQVRQLARDLLNGVQYMSNDDPRAPILRRQAASIMQIIKQAEGAQIDETVPGGRRAGTPWSDTEQWSLLTMGAALMEAIKSGSRTILISTAKNRMRWAGLKQESARITYDVGALKAIKMIARAYGIKLDDPRLVTVPGGKESETMWQYDLPDEFVEAVRRGGTQMLGLLIAGGAGLAAVLSDDDDDTGDM